MKADVLVVGGGLAGSAAAIGLARAGREVLLLEREREAVHKVCGEFLSVETVAMLERLGVDVWALGAERIQHVRLANGWKAGSAKLPFCAASLTRRQMDEALLAVAAKAGVRVVRGVNVESLEKSDAGWKAKTNAEGAEEQRNAEVCARDVVLASGKHDLRGRARLGGEQNDLVAFKQYWRLTEEQTQALRGHVELLLFPDGYGGLQLVEGGNANLCWVMRQKRVQWFRGDASLMLFHMIRHCRLLDERLKDASTQKVKPLAVSAIPYGMVRRETEPGLWCVGDQAAVIPSFTGDGMALALRSGMLAAETLVRGEEANAFQRAFACEAERQVRFAVRLSRWMVEPRMQKLAVGAAQWVPGMMPLIARRTRLRVS